MSSYRPITGPALRKIHAQRKDNRTGCPGISYVRLSTRRESFFAACVGAHRSLRFRIETLGRDEAWRRALRARAAYELAAAATNSAIRSARAAANP